MLLLYNTKWTQCSSSHKASLFFNTKRDAICPLNENSLISATLSPAMDSGHVYPQEFTILVVRVPRNTHHDFSFNFKRAWDKKIQALSSHLEQMKVTWEKRFILKIEVIWNMLMATQWCKPPSQFTYHTYKAYWKFF